MIPLPATRVPRAVLALLPAVMFPIGHAEPPEKLVPSGAAPALHPAAPRPEFPGPAPGPSAPPFSPAVRLGGVIYLSGELGLDPATGALAPGGIGPETRQALTNLAARLASFGGGLKDLVHCTAMLADIGDFAAFNESYRSAFHTQFPARSAFATSGLARGARIELDCIAAAPAAHSQGEGS